LLNQFQERFKDRLVVIGISDEPEAAVRRMTSPAIAYAVAVDQQKRMKRNLQVVGIPHAILVDPSGIVRFEGMPGYLDNDSLATILSR
jgi:thioredoxin-related protein